MTTLEKRARAPPLIGMPPKTMAMRSWVSSMLPEVAVTEPILTALMNAAKPVMQPAAT